MKLLTAALLLAAAPLAAQSSKPAEASPAMPVAAPQGDSRGESPAYTKWFKKYNEQLAKNFSGLATKSEVGAGRALDPEVLAEQLNEAGIAIDKGLDSLANKEAVSKTKIAAALKYAKLYPYSLAAWDRLNIILNELFRSMLIQSMVEKTKEVETATLALKNSYNRAQLVVSQLAALSDLENAELMAAREGVDLRAEMRKGQSSDGQ